MKKIISHSFPINLIISIIFTILPFHSLGFAATITSSLKGNSNVIHLVNGLTPPYPAPVISGIDEWINSTPMTIDSLKGKVVLINFWTYGCINCQHTLPYFNSWYDKYYNKGLVIIGVHSPEFEFESNFSNVSNAVANDGIQYPVALDNEFTTWRNFNNHYWPERYLIDKEGNVVYSHIGEGEYDVTENNIRYLLDSK